MHLFKSIMCSDDIYTVIYSPLSPLPLPISFFSSNYPPLLSGHKYIISVYICIRSSIQIMRESVPYVLNTISFLLSLWEFHTAYFEHIPPFPPTPPTTNLSIVSSLLTQFWGFIIIIFSIKSSLCFSHNLRSGACPGVWTAYRGHIINTFPLTFWKKTVCS